LFQKPMLEEPANLLRGYSKTRDDVSRSQRTPVDATIRSGDLERNEKGHSFPGFAVKSLLLLALDGATEQATEKLFSEVSS
jgi:hypothetical protein